MTTHGPAGPEDVEDPGDVPGVTESASAGRRGAASTLNPSGWSSRYPSRISSRSWPSASAARASVIVTSGRSRRAVETSPNCRSRSRSTTGWPVVRARNSAALVARNVLPQPPEADDTITMRPRPAPAGPCAATPRRPRVMRAARASVRRSSASSAWRGTRSSAPDLDDLGEVGPGPFVEGEDDRHPRIALVERAEAAQPGPVHERRPGDDDVPGAAARCVSARAGSGQALTDGAGADGVVADPGGQFTGAVEDEDPRRGSAQPEVIPPVAIRCSRPRGRRCPRRRA